MSGWYLMHRGWMDHPVFRSEAFSRRDAFVWLIEEAAFKPTVVALPGRSLRLERGQLSHSTRFMAAAWRWSEPKVRRYLTSLRQAKIIDAETDAGQTVITICNYDKYQLSSETGDAASDAQVTHQRRTSDAKKKEGKEIKETTARADAHDSGREYAFEGAVVRLSQKDFDGWAVAYHAIPDLRAELASIDGWWQGQPAEKRAKWFVATSSMLNKRHQKAVSDRSPSSAADDEARAIRRAHFQFYERQEAERLAAKERETMQ